MDAWSIEDLKTKPEAYRAVVELLLQMADDDFIVGYRDQEWLGLAPHIEEDVAFGSIGQEEIGHATYYYQLLEQMGVGSADDLASLRPARERRNAVLLEQPNGSGHFLETPHYDWAWTIVRHYLHDVWEMVRLEVLLGSRLDVLRNVAPKVLAEKRYHRAHQELWLKTMAQHDDQSRARVVEALNHAAPWAGDLPSWGDAGDVLQRWHMAPELPRARARFDEEVRSFFDSLGLTIPEFTTPFNGRIGEHSPALSVALDTLSEVYRLDPTASW